MKDWPAFIVLKSKIDDFNQTCPLLELMADKSMKERHWKRLETLLGMIHNMSELALLYALVSVLCSSHFSSSRLCIGCGI